MALENPNPIINKSPHQYSIEFLKQREKEENDDKIEDPIDKYEIYNLIKNIKDPEHPLTLEEINVVNEDDIEIDNNKKYIKIYYTPTIPNCSLSSLIGLSIKAKLINNVDKRYKIDVLIKPGTQDLEDDINKQLSDKERVLTAIESDNMNALLSKIIKNDNEFEEVYK
jgi:metal-sulfur cluster biosynthetic enzyme